MPSYDFRDKNTGAINTVFLKISELNTYKESNPHLTAVISAPGLISGRSTSSGSLPDGFKDRLREMKKQHPHSVGLDNLI